jgi:AcrR family transcriptional regulator
MSREPARPPARRAVKAAGEPTAEGEKARKPARGRRARRVTGDERERAILETAGRLLGERAFHEVSVDDLARGAGLSRPTFYFYFPSKEAVLLTLIDRMVAQARELGGDAIGHLAEDPPRRWRQAITAIHDTFRAHRAVTLAAAELRATSEEARALWAGVMESFVQETAAIIEAERARGAVPAGVPARDLAIALNLMNERALHATLAGHAPAIDESRVIDTLVAVWLMALYGTTSPPPARSTPRR